ncbi:TonB-dependent receptor [Cellvibrio japonicus]|uniref:Uncharacterized protein n=1 Tax=Cellvibrio japonicus (strain Ueda107) TaxID=498211 RepID=B3PJR2_CELJU|nr:TonB-dependent receptor [Cellvibrio japonicus]ACE85939.1 hypothetical protein CJA_2272 [Cellvibrio japonicus Ueda107]QEI12699.1 TonB-dependent receptor [Cellvibrio japonicus]QEI16273.1 TonB-dependent receptor [Cellvibrio japonicus]QEI19851.1 TonB-dependent receptor [Cellvibrio japonicus]
MSTSNTARAIDQLALSEDVLAFIEKTRDEASLAFQVFRETNTITANGTVGFVERIPGHELLVELGDYTLVGARAGIQTDRWSLFLFANNLTNTLAKTSSGNVLGGSIEAITSAPPRTLGINLNTQF